MSLPLVVLKFGGDALASPERIAAAARQVRRRTATSRLVVVASARRGVTDHLLGLVDQLARALAGGARRTTRGRAAADRAVASGELVSASLLALALNRLGIPAEPLDARQAGLSSDGRFGSARLGDVRPQRIARLLERGVVPVVTGFQGWHRGRVTTLGRGGSDISAVALAVACQARRVEFVKDAAGLMTADPKLVPAAQPIPRASHKLITALAQAGARVLHPAAAELAERHGLPIALFSLDGEAPATLIEREAGQGVLGAVAARGLPRGETALTLVATDRGFARMVARRALPTLAALGIPVLGHGPGVSGFRIVVPSSRAAEALRCTHGELLAAGSQSARVACAAG